MSILSTIIVIVIIIISLPSILNGSLWSIIVFFIVVFCALKKFFKKNEKTNKKTTEYLNSNFEVKNSNNKISYSQPKINYNFDLNKEKSKINYEYKERTKINFDLNRENKSNYSFNNDRDKINMIRQMLNLSIGNSFNLSLDEKRNKLFYLQATFMEDFNDNYDVNVPCVMRKPYFSDMEINQIRSYFSFRTLVRNKKYVKTQSTYIYLYLCELSNLIGVKNSVDGLNKLLDFWINYRNVEVLLDDVMPSFIKNFYIVHNVQIDYSKVVQEFPISFEFDDNCVGDILIGNYSDKLAYFDSISSYHILKSKLMENKYSFLVEMVIPKVFENLNIYFNKNGFNFNDILFGTYKKELFVPFEKGIYYNDNLNDFEVVISGSEKYFKEKNYFYKYEFVSSKYCKYLMGYILKEIDIVFRNVLKINNSLKINSEMVSILKDNNELYTFFTSEAILNLINTTIKKFLVENKSKINFKISEELKKNVDIDENKFDEIRKSSSRVQEKLVIEEDEVLEKVEEVKEIKKSSDNSYVNLINNLDDFEIEFLNKVLKCEKRNDLIDFVKNKNVLFEVVIESINNKSLDIIGDNILEDYGDEVIVYAEYRDYLCDVLGGDSNE